MSEASFEQVAIPVSVGVASFFALMPSVEDCLKSNSELKVMRHTEILVGGVTVLTGFLGTAMTGDKTPLVTALAVTLILVAFYEVTYRIDYERGM